MRKAIVTSYTDTIAAEAQPFVQNQSEYARRWGYQFVCHTGKHDKAWEPGYNKILNIQALLNQGIELVVSLGADVAFTNFTRDIGELVGGKYWLAGLQELGKGMSKYLNADVLVIKNCEASRKCFDTLAARIMAGDHPDRSNVNGIEFLCEQQFLNDYIHALENETDFSGVHACQPDEIGSIWQELGGKFVLREWRYGDLTLHCCGLAWPTRAQVFYEKYLPQVLTEAMPLPAATDAEPIAESNQGLTSEQLTDIRLFIAVPTYQNKVSAITDISMLKLTAVLADAGIPHFIRSGGGERAPRARNKLTDEFIKSGYTHLLFIDSDIGFRPNDILDMLKANVYVLGGVYPLKTFNADKAIATGSEEAGRSYVGSPAHIRAVDESGNVRGVSKALRNCVAFNEVGTGFFLIQRRALEIIRMAHPEMEYADDFGGNVGKIIHAFFFERIVNFRWLSEDYFFCSQWRQCGGTVWGWPWAQLEHEGSHVFQGHFERRVKPSAEKVRAIEQQSKGE